MTLIVFIVPMILLFPLKLVGLWLLAHHHWISAVVTILFAKFLGVGVTAFLFDVTRPKLLQMGWFSGSTTSSSTAARRAAELVDPINGANQGDVARQWRRLVRPLCG